MAIEKGSRKVADGRETLLALLLGLGFCVWLKADVQIYTVFAACAVGKSGIFNLGNAAEHKADASIAVASAASKP